MVANVVAPPRISVLRVVPCSPSRKNRSTGDLDRPHWSGLPVTWPGPLNCSLITSSPPSGWFCWGAKKPPWGFAFTAGLRRQEAGPATWGSRGGRLDPLVPARRYFPVRASPLDTLRVVVRHQRGAFPVDRQVRDRLVGQAGPFRPLLRDAQPFEGVRDHAQDDGDHRHLAKQEKKRNRDPIPRRIISLQVTGQRPDAKTEDHPEHAPPACPGEEGLLRGPLRRAVPLPGEEP